jgi:hypothetical protein
MWASRGGIPDTRVSSQYMYAGAVSASHPQGHSPDRSMAKIGQAHQPSHSKK